MFFTQKNPFYIQEIALPTENLLLLLHKKKVRECAPCSCCRCRVSLLFNQKLFTHRLSMCTKCENHWKKMSGSRKHTLIRRRETKWWFTIHTGTKKRNLLCACPRVCLSLIKKKLIIFFFSQIIPSLNQTQELHPPTTFSIFLDLSFKFFYL